MVEILRNITSILQDILFNKEPICDRIKKLAFYGMILFIGGLVTFVLGLLNQGFSRWLLMYCFWTSVVLLCGIVIITFHDSLCVDFHRESCVFAGWWIWVLRIIGFICMVMLFLIVAFLYGIGWFLGCKKWDIDRYGKVLEQIAIYLLMVVGLLYPAAVWTQIITEKILYCIDLDITNVYSMKLFIYLWILSYGILLFNMVFSFIVRFLMQHFPLICNSHYMFRFRKLDCEQKAIYYKAINMFLILCLCFLFCIAVFVPESLFEEQGAAINVLTAFTIIIFYWDKRRENMWG